MKEKHFGPVWFIPGDNSGKYPFCHSLYIETAGILIDPAANRTRLKELRETPGVKEVWLSHWHEDHFINLDLFDDLPLCIMEEDAYPLSDLEVFMDAYGVDDVFKKDWRPLFHDVFHFRPRKPSRFLKHGDIVDLGSVSVEVIHSPGHTPGHMALLFNNLELLFMADYDLSSFGPWYGDRNSSIEKTEASVKKLKEIPARTWITSHEKGIFEENPGKLWEDYLDVIKIREDKLLELLKTPKTLEDIVKACIIYGKPRKPKYFFEFGEKAHMRKHLEKLVKEKIVAEDNNQYCLI
ncbi:MAG: MBL fold metallo-hydrolase [Deltaproteobacteria bacterium]|nr:MBL fold metallo-hydrolase [Deltaproteobacteria bacterium]